MRPKDEITALTLAALEAHYENDDARLAAVLAELTSTSIDDVRGSLAMLAGMALASVLPPPGEDADSYVFDVGLMEGPQTPVTSLVGAVLACVHRTDATALSQVYAGADADELAEAQLLLLGFVNDARARIEEADRQ